GLDRFARDWDRAFVEAISLVRATHGPRPTTGRPPGASPPGTAGSTAPGAIRLASDAAWTVRIQHARWLISDPNGSTVAPGQHDKSHNTRGAPASYLSSWGGDHMHIPRRLLTYLSALMLMFGLVAGSVSTIAAEADPESTETTTAESTEVDEPTQESTETASETPTETATEPAEQTETATETATETETAEETETPTETATETATETEEATSVFTTLQAEEST